MIVYAVRNTLNLKKYLIEAFVEEASATDYVNAMNASMSRTSLADTYFVEELEVHEG